MPQPRLVVAYGAGRDSTAMIIEMHRRGLRPDAILFANTGSEKRENPTSLRQLLEQAGHEVPEIATTNTTDAQERYREDCRQVAEAADAVSIETEEHLDMVAAL